MNHNTRKEMNGEVQLKANTKLIGQAYNNDDDNW